MCMVENLSRWKTDLFDRLLWGWSTELEPRSQLVERPHHWLIAIDIPNLREDQVRVRRRRRGIEVEIHKDQEEGHGLYRHERHFDGYWRYFPLGATARPRVRISNKDLKIYIPKEVQYGHHRRYPRVA